uniref:EBNA1 binding protein 2 n=1 Tax=Hucho hucho TaxID=62062 RepID=A0A4W5P3L1_9TELE
MILVNNTMDINEDDEQLGETSEEDDSELSDGEEGLKQCLADFRKNTLPWVERLDMVNLPADDIVAKSEGRIDNKASGDLNPDDDFQREMFFYRQAQAAVLEAMPRLLKLKIATKRPEDYFAEMAKSDQQMQKIRKKLIMKQTMMEKSEKAKKLREQRKFGKKVQVEVIQKRQKEKKAMMSAVKKYQKGMTDKLDFLEGDQKTARGAPAKGGAGKTAGGQTPDKKAMNKKGPNAKRKYKDQRFGFGGKKSGTKWNTKDSHNDVSGFRAKVAHGKGGKGGKGGKAGPGGKGGRGPAKGGTKRPGKNARKKMKGRS